LEINYIIKELIITMDPQSPLPPSPTKKKKNHLQKKVIKIFETAIAA
jgi:hypothetical protein